jgi:hypothetical protein
MEQTVPMVENQSGVDRCPDVVRQRRADIDWVVSALLHDIGDIYAPYNYDEYAAAIIRPFVREQCAWVVEKRGDFQMLYGEHVGEIPTSATDSRATSTMATALISAKCGISVPSIPITI